MEPSGAPAQSAILIVDDDPVVRSLERAALENDGFSVIEAGDGEEAVTLCAAHQPELLLVDVVMPRMDGFELCRALRRRPDTEFVPILIATGLDDVPSIARAYEAGATDFISKPLNWLILSHRVRYVLRAGRAFAELRRARDDAEAASRAKTEFLANMSHELRTPLNAIIGFSSMMCEQALGPLDARYVDYARVIAESGTHLLTLINDILDLAKAEANGLILVEEPVDLRRIVALSAAIIEDMARKAEVDFGFVLADDLPVLHGDAAKLRQILINLLSNAVKYTPAHGTVRLTVALEPAGGLALRVADTGIGIAADMLSVALAPFGQVDSGLDRKFAGAGLGLPLTKRLVELHGGTLEIASEPGQGTVVTVRLPAERLGSDQTAIAASALRGLDK